MIDADYACSSGNIRAADDNFYFDAITAARVRSARLDWPIRRTLRAKRQYGRRQMARYRHCCCTLMTLLPYLCSCWRHAVCREARFTQGRRAISCIAI